MKAESKLITWIVKVMILLVVGVSTDTMMYAGESSNEIPLVGEWGEDIRSISPTVPISAYINGNILLIQSSTLRSDITVTIINNGIEIYKQAVPAAQTANIGIPINELESGVYTLELRNQWGEFLYGDFVK